MAGNDTTEGKAPPDGIGPINIESWGGLHRHASPLALVLLLILIAIAVAGPLGGQRSPDRTIVTRDVALTVHMPEIIRNGMFFETVISITPRRPIADLQLGVSPALWHDLTQNTMIPQADKEAFEDGLYRFGYGRGEPGKTLEVKVDLQINPSLTWGTAGDVVVLDGKTVLARLPLSMKVRP